MAPLKQRKSFFKPLMKLIKKYFNNLVSPEENFLSPVIGLKRSILISWPFYIFAKIVLLIFVALFLNQFIGYMSALPQETLGLISKFLDYGSIFRMFFITSFLGIIFFPLIILFEYYFWKVLLKWLLKMTGRVTTDDNLKLIITSSFSSYIFLVFPFIGHSMKTLAQLYLLTRALGKTQNISILLSAFIVCFPIIIQFGLFLSMLLALTVTNI